MKRILKKIYILLHKYSFGLFYNKKYLTGKYFDNSVIGWQWLRHRFFSQKILGKNRHIPWPCSSSITISDYKNIIFDNDDLNNFQGFGNYFQNFASTITIGKGSYIAMNVGLITANHSFEDLDRHQKGKPIVLGKGNWIGMNSVILPGVILGDNTIVGAGSVVTHSFPEGNCILAGVPARKIKNLNVKSFP